MSSDINRTSTDAHAAAPTVGPATVDDCALAQEARAADLRLVERLVARDPGAWAIFVERFQRLVLARVYMCGREWNRPLNETEGEDVCAEVFSQLIADDYASLRRFEGRSTLSTWLSVVTRRIARRRLAALRREPSQVDRREVPGVEDVCGPPEEDPLKKMIASEDRLLLASGLEQLGERHRQLVQLLYFDGCTYREVSQRLQMPMNSIGPTLQRIQQKLRATLEPDES